MNILVIGGSGFVGSRLIRLICKIKHNVHNLDKRPSPFYPTLTKVGDIRDIKNIEKSFTDVDLVILLAAEHRDDISPSSLYYDVNVKGTKNVIDLMSKNNISKIIFTSSVAVYGLNKPNPKESFPVDPFNHYGKSKYEAEKALVEWQKQDPNRSVTIIRPTVIFGENNRGNVYNLLKQISSGTFLMIGKGLNKKSMAYVGNIVAFIDYVIDNQISGVKVYNYVDKPDLTMNELLRQVEISLSKTLPKARLPFWLGMVGGYIFDMISYVSGQKFAISSVRVRKFCATTQFDATEAHSSKFQAPLTLQEGLDSTLKNEFLKNHEDSREVFKPS